jgi:PilZ domain
MARDRGSSMSGVQPVQSSPDSSSDLRGDRRVALLLRAGKLISDQGEFLCILRDASAGGLKARLFHDLPAASQFDLELSNGEKYPVALVWQQDGHAGFRFLERPIDVHGLVDEPSRFPKRDIRLRLSMPVQVTAGTALHQGVLEDLSQNGAQIMVEQGLAIGQYVTLSGDGLPQLVSRVRWRRKAAHGLIFQRGFRLDELAELVSRLRLQAEQDLPGIARSA